MKKVLIIVVFIVLVFGFLSLKKDSASENGAGRVMGPEEFSLGVGQVATFSNLSLIFNELVADYRCPNDAQCVEGGAVVANITLTTDEDSLTFNKPSDEVPAEFGSFLVSIIDTKPELFSGMQIDPQDYVVTFRIESSLSGDNI